MQHLVNITFALDTSLRGEFTEWVEDRLIPHARASVGARAFLLSRIFPPADMPADADELTLALQFRVASSEEASEWTSSQADPMLGECARRWGHRVLPFTTVMEIIPLHQ